MTASGFPAAVSAATPPQRGPGVRFGTDSSGDLPRDEDEVTTGSLCAGSPRTGVRSITVVVRAPGAGRFDLVHSAGGAVPAGARLRAVELHGTQVVPMVHDTLGES